jgi:hypothetical protein
MIRRIYLRTVTAPACSAKSQTDGFDLRKLKCSVLRKISVMRLFLQTTEIIR